MKDNQSSAGPLSANTSLMRPLTIEVFDHAIGLWPSRLDQAKFDAMCLTLHIEGMAATGHSFIGPSEAISEGFVIIGQCGLHLE